MAFFSFSITKNDISPAITRMLKLAADPTPVMRAMGTTFKSITEGTFNSVGASYRPTPWPAKWGGQPSILIKHGVLSKAFHLDITAKTATLSNPTKYAAIHQFGGIIRPKNAPALRFQAEDGTWVVTMKVTIPARPFYPITGDKLTPAAEEKIIAAGERAAVRSIGADLAGVHLA
jgi:phage gpG-like protein